MCHFPWELPASIERLLASELPEGEGIPGSVARLPQMSKALTNKPANPLRRNIFENNGGIKLHRYH